MRKFKAHIMYDLKMEPFAHTRVLIDAYTTDTAHLIVHKELKGNYGDFYLGEYWNISHFPIGMTVLTEIPTRKLAIEIVDKYFSAFNWTALSLKDWEKISDTEKQKMKAARMKAVEWLKVA